MQVRMTGFEKDVAARLYAATPYPVSNNRFVT
jgi:hypothetical protein